MFFDAIFKFVSFWVGDFADVEFECFNTKEQLRRFLNDLGFLQDDCTNTASVFQTLCTRPYSPTKHLLTTQYHFEHAEKLFCNFPPLGTFFVSKSKKTNQPPPPNNNNTIQQKNISSWWPSLAPKSYHPKKGFDLQLHRYPFGSQWSSSMPLLYLGTTPDHQTD